MKEQTCKNAIPTVNAMYTYCMEQMCDAIYSSTGFGKQCGDSLRGMDFADYLQQKDGY